MTADTGTQQTKSKGPAPTVDQINADRITQVLKHVLHVKIRNLNVTVVSICSNNNSDCSKGLSDIILAFSIKLIYGTGKTGDFCS